MALSIALYLYCAFKTVPDIEDLESLLDTALGLVTLGEGGPSETRPNPDQ
ncbi:MAG: hypothetical protein OQK74_00300 [Gammaproteobacteria bacterium]|nr:hypothetical protein [Gammaproteobacteria bacterium]